jgi:hypothetical protein
MTDPYTALATAVQRREAVRYPEGHADAELADERVALAARELVRHVEASGSYPAGWDDSPVNGVPDDPSWPAHRVMACGRCGTRFGTNCQPGDIECTDCEARLCSSCWHWEVSGG